MKTTTALMTGLITCTTVLHARSINSTSLDGNDKLATTTPAAYREILWTNGVSFPSIETQRCQRRFPSW